ncbi:MAG: hypothetical protein ACRCW9_05995 [Cetobacterium sp.]
MVLRKILNNYYLCKKNPNCKGCINYDNNRKNCQREFCIIHSIILGPIGARQTLMLTLNSIEKKEKLNFITNKASKILKEKEGEHKEFSIIDFKSIDINGEENLKRLKELNESVLKKRNYHNKAKINYVSDTQIEIIYRGIKDILPIITYKEENQNG